MKKYQINQNYALNSIIIVYKPITPYLFIKKCGKYEYVLQLISKNPGGAYRIGGVF